MKNVFVVICIWSLMACGNEKKEVMASEVSASDSSAEEVVSNAAMDETGNPLNSSRVPLYNFDELEERYLKNSNDTTYVVNFWATWCKPCVAEMPAFETVNANYKDQKLKVVLVSLDFPEKLNTLVIPFIDRKDITSKVVLLDDPDANTWIPKVSGQWSGAIPATIIVKNGEASFHEGSITLNELETNIKTIL